MLEEDVRQAMARRPNVPAVAGWLRLDRRGQWWLRGARVTHPNSLAFIAANYAHDHQGRYFFQNGPQRVFVQLDLVPYIYRVSPNHTLTTHTGKSVTEIRAAYIDEHHNLYLETEFGIGLIHDADLDLVSEALHGDWNETPLSFHWKGRAYQVKCLLTAELCQFGFEPNPTI